MARYSKEGKHEKLQDDTKILSRKHSWVDKIQVSSSENRFALSKVHHEIKGDIPKITVPSELMVSFSPKWHYVIEGHSVGPPTASQVVKATAMKEWEKSGLEIGMRKEGDSIQSLPDHHPSPEPIPKLSDVSKRGGPHSSADTHMAKDTHASDTRDGLHVATDTRGEAAASRCRIDSREHDLGPRESVCLLLPHSHGNLAYSPLFNTLQTCCVAVSTLGFHVNLVHIFWFLFFAADFT